MNTNHYIPESSVFLYYYLYVSIDHSGYRYIDINLMSPTTLLIYQPYVSDSTLDTDEYQSLYSRALGNIDIFLRSPYISCQSMSRYIAPRTITSVQRRSNQIHNENLDLILGVISIELEPPFLDHYLSCDGCGRISEI